MAPSELPSVLALALEIRAAVSGTRDSPEISEGLRIAGYRALEELPCLVFGVITIAYIVMSFARLAP